MSPAPVCARCGQPVTPGARFCTKCGSDVSGEQGNVATAHMTAVHQPEDGIELLRRATMGEYEILTELGRGGMATVYLAHEISLDRKVAIKLMAPHVMFGQGMAERFRREARTAASLSHPHIIPIYTVKESQGVLYFVMKFIPGRPLDDIIREVGPLPIPMVKAILSQVGSALGYAHRRGIIHRDIKPANIMIDDEGWAIVTDFGIAKVAETHGLTMTGVAVGTPSYMSPEQCAAKEVTGRSDQYSLGIVAYEMITGKQPFVADTAMAIMWQHFNDPPPPITDSRSDCPREVEAIVLRMLAKQPDGRYPSIDEVVGAIGAPPMTHDDPTRLKMIELARSSLNQRLLDEMKTPTSLVPPSRDSGKRTTVVAGVGSVAVSPRSAGLAVGETVQLAAFLQDTEGKTLADRKVEWASTAPQVATISTSGLVTAVGPGEVMITASCEGHVGTSTLTISPASVASVVLAPATTSLEAGATVQLTATAKDASGRPLADRDAAWSSSAPHTASVSVAGLVTGAAPGSAKITVTVEKKSASASVTVTAIPAAAVELSPGTLSLHVGATARLSATVKDARGRALADRPVTWASRAPAIVRVADGLATALATGESEITATCEGASGTARVAVTPVPVARVVPSEQSLSLDVGQAVRLAAKVLADDGTALEGRKVTWESGDKKTVTISVAGEVVGAAPGSATVTVSCEGKSAPVAVKVSPVAVSSVQLSPPSLALEVGRTARFTSLARDARGHELPGRDAAWTSSKPAIARVSTDGEVTGLAAGFAVVTATVEGRKATGEVKVTAPVVADAGPEERTVKVPGISRVTEPVAVSEPEPARPRPREVAVPEPRKSRAPLLVVIALLAVAAVAAVVFLRPKPVGPGGTTAVSGGDVPAGPVALVAIAPATATLSVGDSVALLPTFLDSAGTKIQGGTVQWTSDNPAVATVSDGGVVRGMSGGNATIIVSAGEVRGVASVTVQGAAAADHVPIASITIPAAPASLPVGESVELTVDMKDKDGASAHRAAGRSGRPAPRGSRRSLRPAS